MAEVNSTCYANECNTSVFSKGLCSKHYTRLRKTGTLSLLCVACGAEISSSNGGTRFCSRESCQQCSVRSCGRKRQTKGYCDAHYRRLKKLGSPYKSCVGCGKPIADLNGKEYCSPECHPVCSIEGCSEQVEGRGYCKAHYHSVYKGRDPKTYRKPVPLAERKYKCLICKSEFDPWGQSSKVCSSKCLALYEKYGENVPSLNFTCVKCGVFVERDRFSGSHFKPSRSRCNECLYRQKDHELYRKFYGSARSRVKDCVLCGEEINRSLAWPHPKSKSMDHIVPLSKGGSDDLSNLQLVHLRCNMRKNDSFNEPFQMRLAL